jgi:HEAT repeat protein
VPGRAAQALAITEPEILSAPEETKPAEEAANAAAPAVTPLHQPKPEMPAEAKPQAPAAPVAAPFKRLQMRDEKELLELASRAPVVALDRSAGHAESKVILRAAVAAKKAGTTNHEMTLRVLGRRADLAGLPLRRGTACKLPRADAAHFDERVLELRGGTSDVAALRKRLTGNAEEAKWLKSESVPVLLQMLMPEATPVRVVLVEQLTRIPGERATSALAQIALFDLDAKVREGAIKALAGRPARHYQRALLKGFEHPWSVVSAHAAEALVALEMKDAVPDLVKLLEKREPKAPYRKGGEQYYVKELVRVNHVQNCLLCHPPSYDSRDKVRRMIPWTETTVRTRRQTVGIGSGLGYGFGGGYGLGVGGTRTVGLYVRADITFLKQGLSAMLPVKKGKAGEPERFDFFVRERAATQGDIQAALYRKKAGLAPQRQSILFALRELTGRDLGGKVEDWKEFLQKEGL